MAPIRTTSCVVPLSRTSRNVNRRPDLGAVNWGSGGWLSLCEIAQSETLMPRIQTRVIEQTHTSWTLNGDGRRMTCTLIGTSGEYLLSITHKGRCLMVERCTSPQDALSKSIDALGALIATYGFNDAMVDGTRNCARLGLALGGSTSIADTRTSTRRRITPRSPRAPASSGCRGC
jgi:hypothetical protein